MTCDNCIHKEVCDLRQTRIKNDEFEILNDICADFEKSPYAPKTNREWLNSLSNEQLADFLTENLQVKSCTGFVYCTGISKIKYREISSVRGILRWLNAQQEFNIYEESWDH